MKAMIVFLFALTLTVANAEAKPSKYGFKGNTEATASQEVAVETDATAEEIERIEPAAGDVQEEIENGSSINRRFKNK